MPVGLGEKLSENCITDKIGENISNKNQFYGEYTFHYWIWKNYLDKIQTKWVGFCQYRKFSKNNAIQKDLSFDYLREILIKNVNLPMKNLFVFLEINFL